MLYSLEAVLGDAALGGCCTWWMLYAVDAGLGGCCTWWMLYSVDTALGVNS